MTAVTERATEDKATSEAVTSVAVTSPPLCQLTTTNSTEGATNTTTLDQGCTPRNASKGRHRSNLKIIHMQPEFEGKGLLLEYDPMTGIQTAAILGSCLMLVMMYVIYKAKCRKQQWTSNDRIFIENYKRRLTGKWIPNNDDLMPRQDERPVDQTAVWIDSQPLDASQQSMTTKVASCNICLESMKMPNCPLCSSISSRQVPTANGVTPFQQIAPVPQGGELENTTTTDQQLLCPIHSGSFVNKKCRHKQNIGGTRKAGIRPNTLALRRNSTLASVNLSLRKDIPMKGPGLRRMSRNGNPRITRADTVDTSNMGGFSNRNIDPGKWTKEKKLNKSLCDNTSTTISEDLPQSKALRLSKQNRLPTLDSPPRERRKLQDRQFSLQVPLKIPSTTISLFTVPGSALGTSKPMAEISANHITAPCLPRTNQKARHKCDLDSTSFPLLSANQNCCNNAVPTEEIPFMDDGSSYCGSTPHTPRLANTQL